MKHRYPRTERDLRWLAVNFSLGNITNTLPERLECLAAYHRFTIEAEKKANGEPHDYDSAARAYDTAVDRMRAAGVGLSEGELSHSPCCGPDSSPSRTP